MRSTGLVELEAAVAVARTRSFRAAAAEIGVSRTALSAAIQSLEARIETRLFHRTTRSVSLTEAGERFIAAVSPALTQIDAAITAARSPATSPAGTLRINCSLGAAQRIVEPFVGGFLREHPAVRAEIVTESRLVDIVKGGFDAGIRVVEDVPRDMVAVRLGLSLRFVVVGAPSLVRVPPTRPADLSKYPCVRFRGANGDVVRWEFSRRGRAVRVDVEGALTVDAVDVARNAARAGVGLAYLPEWFVADDLRSRRLVSVLDDWTPWTGELCLYYPKQRFTPPALRAFIEWTRQHREARTKPVR